MTIWRTLRRNSLWIISIGLMLASSGIDGAYMTAWMPVGAGWLGYVLNTTSDVASEILMYWFGRLQQERKGSKKWRFSWWILPAEIVIIGFSWFFGWRQLRLAMMDVEGMDTWWVAPIAAAFVPVLLAAVGYTQALVSGKLDEIAEKAEEARKQLKEARELKEFATEYHQDRKAPDYATYQVMERDGWKCYYCGTDMEGWDRGDIHVDHFYPTSAGGSDDDMNLVVSCKRCNLKKNSRLPSPDEVAQFKAYLVSHQDIATKEKVWLLDELNVFDAQKDLASAIDTSPSYVSASLKSKPDSLSDSLASLCKRLDAVGKPETQDQEETSNARAQ